MNDGPKIALALVAILVLLNEYMKTQFLGLWVSPSGATVSLERDSVFGVKFAKYDLMIMPNMPVLTYQKKPGNAQLNAGNELKFTPLLGKAEFDLMKNDKVSGTMKLTRVENNMQVDTKENNGLGSGSTKTELWVPANLVDYPEPSA